MIYLKTHPVKRNTQKVPAQVFTYLNTHFEGAFLSEITRETDRGNHTFFKVNASLEDMLYHLKFNSQGLLVDMYSEPIHELYDEEYGLID